MSLIATDGAQLFARPLAVDEPERQSAPLVFSSPHSGRHYPEAFLRQSPLAPEALRRSEDSFVDELFAAAPELGAPLLRALFPRAYLDPNREAWELDPRMFAEPLPAFVNSGTARVREGFGTIARLVTGGAEIYPGKLRFAAARARIDALYRPYHDALERLLATTRQRFGWALLIDCHSMPSFLGPSASGSPRADIVLGDRFGASCAGPIVARIEAAFRREGLGVARNVPFAGGFITGHYGRPREQVHALQIEINRALYMDEARFARHHGFSRLVRILARLIGELAAGPDLARAA